MEAWLGTRDDDNNDTLTVEDCLPISDDVYRQAVAVFQTAWDPSNTVVMSAASSLLQSSELPENPLSPAVYHHTSYPFITFGPACGSRTG